MVESVSVLGRDRDDDPAHLWGMLKCADGVFEDRSIEER
jgi:hypothetical protein